MEPSPDPSTRSSAHSPSGDTSCGSQEIGRIFGGLFLFSYEEAAPQDLMSVIQLKISYTLKLVQGSLWFPEFLSLLQ